VTTDAAGNYINIVEDLTLTVNTPATAPVQSSYVSLGGDVGLNGLGTYDFYYQISTPIPAGGSLKLTLPRQVRYNTIFELRFKGQINIKSQVTLTKGQSSSQIVLTNAIDTYLMSGLSILFSIEGIRNPSDTFETDSFIIESFDNLDYAIEKMS